MEDLLVCRICLIANVKMYNLSANPINHYYSNTIGDNFVNNMQLPRYACFECAALIKKSYIFKEKSMRSQAVLNSLLESIGKVTLQDIAQVDRLKLKLISNYSNCNKINNYDIDEDNPDEEHKVDVGDVKNEVFMNDDDYDIQVSAHVEAVKRESTFDEAVLSEQFFSDNDDEPLSVHKSKKEKKDKRNQKKRGRKNKEIVKENFIDVIEKSDVEASEDISELLPILQLEATTQKRKRGRPRKNPVADTELGDGNGGSSIQKRRTQNTGAVPPMADDGNLEDYVTIIKLSLKEQIEEVNMRKDSSNYKNSQFQCNHCYRGFIDTDAWKHHIKKHDPSSGDAECPVCKFRFKTKRILKKHACNHEMKYACKSCSHVSKTITQAKQHQRWHKGVTYKCQYCDEILSKWTSYLSHVRIKHPSEFICDVCGYSFVSKLGLTMHRTMMHKDIAEKEAEGTMFNEGPYCADCDVKFISEEAYKRHMVTSVKHINEPQFKHGCRKCGEVFHSSEDLRLHHRQQHARPRPPNYGKKPSQLTFPTPCQHCSEEILNARDYWVHFRRAHPDENYPIQRDYVCDICGKGFRGNAFLQYHKRTHEAERPFACAECPKSFFNRVNLLMHARTHSDARPHACSLCPKAFKCKGALLRHFRCHTGEKPYPCEVCGKAFGQSNSRKLHVRTVHLQQPAPYVSRARLQRRLKARTVDSTLQAF